MKPKIDLDALAQLTYQAYEQQFKREVTRAQQEGRTDCVVLSDFKFACGTTATLMVIGEFSGKVQRFYKQMRRQRASTNDFAMGSIYFEPKEDGTTTLHLALQAGKARPADIKRNGKKAFQKIGLEVNIYKGEPNGDATLDEEERMDMSRDAVAISREAEIQEILRKYKKELASVYSQVVPKLSANAFAKEDFESVKRLYTLSKAFQTEYLREENSDKDKYAAEFAAIKKQELQVAKLLAKIKQVIMETNTDGDKTVVVNEAWNRCHNWLDLGYGLAKRVFDCIDAEMKKPLEPTDLADAIAALEKEVLPLGAWMKEKEWDISLNNPEYTGYVNRFAYLDNYLNIAKQRWQEFEAKRLEESQLVDHIKAQWNIVEPLQQHVFEQLKGRETNKVIYNFESKLLTELNETVVIWLQAYRAAPQRIQIQLESDLALANSLLEKVKNIQTNYNISPHPSGKDALFDSYVQLDQTQPLELIAQSIEKLDNWLDQQKEVAEKFAAPVELDVQHFVQQGPTDCKLTCEKMLAAYVKKKGMNAKDFAIGSFGDKSGYISIVKEDKTKAESIVITEGKRYESLENDALIHQNTEAAAYQYIFEQLDLGAPLVVGVDHTYNRVLSGKKGSVKSEEGGYNSDKTTDHFIVIYGKGMENAVPFLLYLDPGTKKGENAKENRLFPIWNGDTLAWYDPKGALGKSYLLSAVCKFKKDC